MALRSLSYEGGTAGSTLTEANSGLDIVVLQANATLVYSTAQAAHGTKSALVTLSSAGASNTASMVYNLPASTTQAATRAYFRVAASPTQIQPSILMIGNTTGGAAGRVGMNTDRTLRVDNADGTTIFTSAALAVNTWYRIELAVARGTTTTDGTINFAVYAGDGTTPITTGSFSSSAVNAGTNSLSNAQAGWCGTTPALAYSFHVDDFAAQDGSTAYIGPAVVSNTAPTANAGPDQTGIEPKTTVTLTGSGTDTDGTIASYAWTQTGGTAVTLSGTGANRTFAAPLTLSGDTLTFQLTVTDNGGATGTDTVAVTVLPAPVRILVGGVMRPARMRLNP